MASTARKIYVTDEAGWHEMRKKGIGGSDAGAVCGLNPWKSPVQVWLEKTGQADSYFDNERMYWGRRLEDIIADHFAEINGVKVRRNNAILQHAEVEFMQANLDREIVGEDAVLEIKTVGEFAAKSWNEGDLPAVVMKFNEDGQRWVLDKEAKTGNIPDHYKLQVQHYLAVTGCSRAFVGALVGGQRYMQFEILRDEELIGYLMQIEADFWPYVENNIAPPMDEASLTASTLNALYPTSNGQTIILPEEAMQYISEYELHGSEEKAAKDLKEQAKLKLQNLLGEAECGTVGGKLVKWKTTTRKGYMVAESIYRGFGISTLKEK